MDPAKTHRESTALPSAAPSAGAEPVAGQAPTPSAVALTPEEQMARYEHSLKEEDWGHQPC